MMTDNTQLLEDVNYEPVEIPAKPAVQTHNILSDGVHIRANFVPKQLKITTKTMPGNRVSILAQGSVVVEDGPIKTLYKAPAHIKLEADKKYTIITLEDSVWYGINPTQATEVDQIINVDLQPEHFFAGGVYAKKMIIKQGTQVPTHKHIFDHMSLLAQGRVRVAVGRITTEYVAPTMIEIKKEMVHTVSALEDSVWYCIHATNETDPENIDHTLVLGE